MIGSFSSQDPSEPVANAPVRNGDRVELFHFSTKKLLNSHDVAAPLSPTLQEVAGYINYSAQFTPYLQWELVQHVCCLLLFIVVYCCLAVTCFIIQEVPGLELNEPIFWEKGKLTLKLLHSHSKQALSVSKGLRGSIVKG